MFLLVINLSEHSVAWLTICSSFGTCLQFLCVVLLWMEQFSKPTAKVNNNNSTLRCRRKPNPGEVVLSGVCRMIMIHSGF